MRKLILHVGCGKAGSTSIQRALLACSSDNKDFFAYPVIPNSHGNQMLRFAFCDVADTPLDVRQKYSGKDKNSAYMAYQQEIKDAFVRECGNASTVVLSSEFWFIASESEVLDFKNFVSVLGFSEIHVVMYLRDPAKYYLSYAQQALKNRSKIPNPASFRYKMLEAIANWKLIEPDSFTVREFERDKLIDADVVADFKCILEKIVNVAKLELRHVLNETLTSEVTQVVQDCYLYIADNDLNNEQSEIVKSSIRDLIKGISQKGSRPVLRDDLTAFIYSNYASELKAINSEYAIFDDVCYKDFEISKNKIVFSNDFRGVVASFDEEIYADLRKSVFSSFLSQF